MLNDPEFRKNLLVSLITSVVVLIFIEPILKWVANSVMWLGANISDSFTKSLYTSAALGFREKYSFIALMFILATLSGVMAGFVSAKLGANNKPSGRQTKISQKAFSVIMAFIFFLSALQTLATNFIELQLNASFNQRVTVLAAKLPDQRVKELKASWAAMKSRADYESLTTEMDNLAKSSGIVLPKALWD